MISLNRSNPNDAKPNRAKAFLRSSMNGLVHLAVLVAGGAALFVTFQVAHEKDERTVGGPSGTNPANARSVEAAIVNLKTTHRESIELASTFVGTFQPFEQFELGFETAGTIQGLNAEAGLEQLREGDLVEVGQTVARMDTTRLLYDLQTTKLELKKAEADLRRSEKMKAASSMSVAAREVEEHRIARDIADLNVRRLKTLIQRASIQAPATSIVARRFRRAGESANAFEPVLQLLNVSELLLVVGIPESRVHEIVPGQMAQVKVVRRPGLFGAAFRLMGEVFRIAESSDERTGAFSVAILVPNWISVVHDERERGERSSSVAVGGRRVGNDLVVHVDGANRLQLDLRLAGIDRTKQTSVSVIESVEAVEAVEAPNASAKPTVLVVQPSAETVVLAKEDSGWRIADDATSLFDSNGSIASVLATSEVSARLRPGMVAEARIVTNRIDGYRLHSDWIVRRNGRLGVFTVANDHVARFLPIEESIEQGPWSVVRDLDFLDSTEAKIVTRGHHRLSHQDAVSVQDATIIAKADALPSKRQRGKPETPVKKQTDSKPDLQVTTRMAKSTAVASAKMNAHEVGAQPR